MDAYDAIFPPLQRVRRKRGGVRFPHELSLAGETAPAWLRKRLAAACNAAGVALAADGGTRIELVRTEKGFDGIDDAAIRSQAYRLALAADGGAVIESPSRDGLRHGLITLALLLEAKGRGLALPPAGVTDAPVFAVRGFQIDFARDYFPSMAFLKRMIDRAADLKLNTIWFYLENRFHAPGIEDISPPGGMTPAQARTLSRYGARRGIDIVPGTNVLSHMEGWLRLERYSDFVDGSMRSYPVLTDRRVWPLVRAYLDELVAAFPSPNVQVGLDELLFTGTHPAAAAAIERKGKTSYFADFACKVIDYLQTRHGKRVWMFDDMVLGKNIDRPEGFGAAYREALDPIPRDVVMVHWYYWTDRDGMHGPIMKRVGEAGRPFVVAPSGQSQKHDFAGLADALDNQAYLAQCGETHGAFGFVNTNWENRTGSPFILGWPTLALGAGFAWRGGGEMNPTELDALCMTLTGDRGALVDVHRHMDAVQDLLHEAGVGPRTITNTLFRDGPHIWWRRFGSRLDPRTRRRVRTLLGKADRACAKVGARDPEIVEGLRWGLLLFEKAFDILDDFDGAWDAWHRAAELERVPGRQAEFRHGVEETVAGLRAVQADLRAVQKGLRPLQRRTGHTPYDGFVLGEWIDELNRPIRLARRAATAGNGLPYFERLLELANRYGVANEKRLDIQNTFEGFWHERTARQTVPPVRRAARSRVKGSSSATA